MRIILGVTGSIAAYKALDLCRELVKDQHEVQVVLTKGALEFVQANTFHYLGAKKVFLPQSDFSTDHQTAVLHIQLARWCERFIVYPASANTFAKFANGLSDDLLSCIFLSLKDVPIILYPAMNTAMLNHPMTQRNFRSLELIDHLHLHSTDSGTLICHETGLGKLASIDMAKELLFTLPAKKISKKEEQANVLITTGATISPIDPIRYVTNASSGLTGLYLAKKFLSEGHRVHVIAGIKATQRLEFLQEFKNFRLTRVTTPEDMYQVTIEEIERAQLFLACAAVGDMQFPLQTQKLKKEKFNGSISYEKTRDILFDCLQKGKKNQFFIGMAAETDLSPQLLKEKFLRKKVDLLIGNEANHGYIEGQKALAFNHLNNTYYFLEKSNPDAISGPIELDKIELSNFVYEWFIRKRIEYAYADSLN